MAWIDFFVVIIGSYALYYVLNILYDLFFSGRRKPPAVSNVHYDIRALTQEEEGPEEVGDEPEEEAVAMPPAKRKKTAEPALRVEGQGIPLEDFLRDAKSYSKSIF